MTNPTLRLCYLSVLLAVGCLARPAGAASPAPTAPSIAARALRVGVVESPPFAMRQGGEWTGLAVELWRLAADQLALHYRFVATDDLEALLDAVAREQVDVALGPLVITPELQRRMDFTIPYLHAGVAIASLPPTLGGWLRALWMTVSSRVGKAVVGLMVGSLLFGMIVWLLERSRNADHFGGGPIKGIGEGIWWATSTMTTVGYGDRIPVTLLGRAIGIVWMLASVVLISGFTALVTSTLTVHQLRPIIRSVADLAHVQVGAVRASAAAAYLRRNDVDLIDYDDLETGLQDVAEGKLVAFVGEAPSVRYLARKRFRDRVVVAPHVFDYEYIALALPIASPWRRQLNVALLQALRTSAWESETRRFLGS